MKIHHESQTDIIIMFGLRLIRSIDKRLGKNHDDLNQNFLSNITQSLQRLLKQYPLATDIWTFLIHIFNELSLNYIQDIIKQPENLAYINELKISSEEDQGGNQVQQNLHPDQRKKLAANYTTIQAAKIVTYFLDHRVDYKRIADPFCGSGRLITTLLENERFKQDSPVIWINDIHPDAVIIGYYRILQTIKKKYTDWEKIAENINATIGDAFQQKQIKTNAWDLIIMNPPYTRVENLLEEMISYLKSEYYLGKQPLMGQPGLHIYALILANRLLREGGVIAAVLPASTFLSQYSHVLQEFLLSNYQVSQLVVATDQKAFSDDSQFRELLFYAKKQTSQNQAHNPTKFIRISSNLETKLSLDEINCSYLEISQERLQIERNWVKFLLPPKLQEWAEKVIDTKLIKSGQALGIELVRGVEMYGPDFFFLPNKYWDVKSITSQNVTIIGNKDSSYNNTELKIDIEYLMPCFRKPGLYNDQISPNLKEYAIKIPSETRISQDLNNYIKWTEPAAEPAIKQFGNKWKSHIDHQLRTKLPYGFLFFADKFGLNTTGTFIHFHENSVTCTKNFYVIKGYNKDANDFAKLMAAWLSSTWYLLLFLYHRREIGGSYGRLQIMDLLAEPLFLDLTKLPINLIQEILLEFDILRQMTLPPIPQQLIQKTKLKLDNLFTRIFGWDQNKTERQVAELYQIIIKELEECIVRDG